MAAVHGKVTAFVGLTQEKLMARAIQSLTTCLGCLIIRVEPLQFLKVASQARPGAMKYQAGSNP